MRKIEIYTIPVVLKGEVSGFGWSRLRRAALKIPQDRAFVYVKMAGVEKNIEKGAVENAGKIFVSSLPVQCAPCGRCESAVPKLVFDGGSGGASRKEVLKEACPATLHLVRRFLQIVRG